MDAADYWTPVQQEPSGTCECRETPLFCPAPHIKCCVMSITATPSKPLSVLQFLTRTADNMLHHVQYGHALRSPAGVLCRGLKKRSQNDQQACHSGMFWTIHCPKWGQSAQSRPQRV